MRLCGLFRWGAIAILSLGLVVGGFTAPTHAQEQSLPGGFTADQAQGIERIVREYLLDNPEVLIDTLREYQRREKMTAEQSREQIISQRHGELARDPATPVMGNPDGDVVVVEFFDYRCPYCKAVAPMIKEEVANDGNVRLVMKEFPILGPKSVQGARAALAAAMQGKYDVFHFALMTQPGDMSDAHIETVAKQVGLDIPRLRRDMKSPEIEDAINRNLSLAEAIGIRGTPAFIIGKTVVPGAIDVETFRQLIAEAREQSS